ncbi:hypothetical protein K438DRAFT_72884 [Mycena galopus ATCC 62051]|nr:hypothetical protein K438DRAFT_72884 [Mycena galopus ATCC 62051]
MLWLPLARRRRAVALNFLPSACLGTRLFSRPSWQHFKAATLTSPRSLPTPLHARAKIKRTARTTPSTLRNPMALKTSQPQILGMTSMTSTQSPLPRPRPLPAVRNERARPRPSTKSWPAARSRTLAPIAAVPRTPSSRANLLSALNLLPPLTHVALINGRRSFAMKATSLPPPPRALTSSQPYPSRLTFPPPPSPLPSALTPPKSNASQRNVAAKSPVRSLTSSASAFI